MLLLGRWNFPPDNKSIFYFILLSLWAILWKCPSTTAPSPLSQFLAHNWDSNQKSSGSQSSALQIVFFFSHMFANPCSSVFFLLPEAAPTHAGLGAVTALCYTLKDSLLLAGYESGLFEIWQHNAKIGCKQVKTCKAKETNAENLHVGITVSWYLFHRLLTVASLQSPLCLITSLQSAM